jgi:hypothetical protein
MRPAAHDDEQPSAASAAVPAEMESLDDPDPDPCEANDDFNGVWLKNADRMTARKSIVIFGVPRGGTTFAASVFAQLGVPFSRRCEGKIGRIYEHRDLKIAFKARDRDALRRIAHEFSAEHEVWAWKCPAVHQGPGFLTDLLPNPHFVLIFKEPLSVAARKNDVHDRDTLTAMSRVLGVYRKMIDFVDSTGHPLMAISYDRAMARMEPFLREVADFAGIEVYDFDKVGARIRQDGIRYLESPGLKAARAAKRRAPDRSQQNEE